MRARLPEDRAVVLQRGELEWNELRNKSVRIRIIVRFASVAQVYNLNLECLAVSGKLR
jgi:hypothetical protein